MTDLSGLAAYSIMNNANLKKYNCYAYAMGINNKWLIPGQGNKNKPDKVLPYNTSIEKVRDWVINDFGKNKARAIKSATDTIYSNEYRIAVRLYIYDGNAADFHFMKQHSNGSWSHKLGERKPISLGLINPSVESWEYNGKNGFRYNSKTLYLAVKM